MKQYNVLECIKFILTCVIDLNKLKLFISIQAICGGPHTQVTTNTIYSKWSIPVSNSSDLKFTIIRTLQLFSLKINRFHNNSIVTIWLDGLDHLEIVECTLATQNSQV